MFVTAVVIRIEPPELELFHYDEAHRSSSTGCWSQRSRSTKFRYRYAYHYISYKHTNIGSRTVLHDLFDAQKIFAKKPFILLYYWWFSSPNTGFYLYFDAPGYRIQGFVLCKPMKINRNSMKNWNKKKSVLPVFFVSFRRTFLVFTVWSYLQYWRSTTPKNPKKAEYVVIVTF